MMDLNQFYEWQRKGKHRFVRIELGSPGNRDEFIIWVYDFGLGIGQRVNSVEEIDLESTLEARERREYEELKEKFEG